jgi:uncharacterized protein YdhG (YjbR/CyaY superfamily)
MSGMSQTEQVQAYLDGLEATKRSALERLRAQIMKAAPEAVEGMSYGLPAFKLHGRALVYYGAAKAHCAFYPGSAAVIAELATALKDYATSKGTIRFPAESPLPEELVARIVRLRIAENEALERKKKTR